MGEHEVALDPQFRVIEIDQKEEEDRRLRNLRHFFRISNGGPILNGEDIETELTRNRRAHIRTLLPQLASNTTVQSTYRFIHKTCNSEDLTTFVQLEDKSTVLHVTNLKKRLVISLPENLHDLRTTRFFLLVKSNSKSSSFGFLHFRQDQLHIDLFVFFSVFF